MFKDALGLTRATLEEWKTMTRRIVTIPKKFKGVENLMLEFQLTDRVRECFVCDSISGKRLGSYPLPYKVGDYVPIAQSYKDAGVSPREVVGTKDYGQNMFSPIFASESAGWRNKMFVLGDLMPNQIHITDLWFERMQDISDEDCLREGVRRGDDGYWIAGTGRLTGGLLFDTPRKAFAFIIDYVSGYGTWESNPWVVAYTYELVK